MVQLYHRVFLINEDKLERVYGAELMKNSAYGPYGMLGVLDQGPYRTFDRLTRKTMATVG